MEIIAFISHATVDNERFALRFNEALCKHVTTIMDAQDFVPGDSLLKSMLNDGIYRANAVIFIISKNTGERPYIAAELEHAVLRNINENIPIIPVILDNATVPPELRTLIQIRVDASQSPEQIADEVAQALTKERYPKVQAGKPSPAQWYAVALQDLRLEEPIDDFVMRSAVESLLAGNYEYVSTAPILCDIEQSGRGGVPEFEASLGILERHGYIRTQTEQGTRLPIAFELTTYGADVFLGRYAPDLYSDALSRVEERVRSAFPAAVAIEEVAAEIASPPMLVWHIGKLLEGKGVAKTQDETGSFGYIKGEPEISRM